MDIRNMTNEDEEENTDFDSGEVEMENAELEIIPGTVISRGKL